MKTSSSAILPFYREKRSKTDRQADRQTDIHTGRAVKITAYK
jgi:hypothetical protein